MKVVVVQVQSYKRYVYKIGRCAFIVARTLSRVFRAAGIELRGRSVSPVSRCRIDIRAVPAGRLIRISGRSATLVRHSVILRGPILWRFGTVLSNSVVDWRRVIRRINARFDIRIGCKRVFRRNLIAFDRCFFNSSNMASTLNN